MPGADCLKELSEQPSAWREVASKAREVALPEPGGDLLFVGSGIAYYLAEALARVSERATGLVSRALPAQDLFTGAHELARRPRTTFVISRSGDVTDAVRAAKAARRADPAGHLVALLGESGGPLTEEVDDVMACGIEEQSVSSTKTLTSMLYLGISSLFRSGAGPANDLAELPGVLERAMPAIHALANSAVDRGFNQAAFLGTGSRYGVARAAALGVREMALLPTSGDHTLIYPHAHMVTLDERSVCVFFLSNRDREDELAVVAEASRLGARTIITGANLSEHAEAADDAIDFGAARDDDTVLPLMMVLPQVLGYRLALAKGLDPSYPPGQVKAF